MCSSAIITCAKLRHSVRVSRPPCIFGRLHRQAKAAGQLIPTLIGSQAPRHYCTRLSLTYVYSCSCHKPSKQRPKIVYLRPLAPIFGWYWVQHQQIGFPSWVTTMVDLRGLDYRKWLARTSSFSLQRSKRWMGCSYQ